MTARRTTPPAPHVRFTPYADTCAELHLDPDQLLTETATLLTEMRGLFGAAATATGTDPQTVTIALPPQPPTPPPARRPR